MTTAAIKCPVKSLSPVHFRAMVASEDFPINPGDKLHPVNKDNHLYCRVSHFADLTYPDERFPSLTAAATFLQREWLGTQNTSPLDGWTRMCIISDSGRVTIRKLFEREWWRITDDAGIIADKDKLWRYMLDNGADPMTMGADPSLFSTSSGSCDGW